MGAHGPTEKDALNGLFGEINEMIRSGELKEVSEDDDFEMPTKTCKCGATMECVGGDEGGAETYWCKACGTICIDIDGDEEWKQRNA